MKQFGSFEFVSETIWVEVETTKNREDLEAELFDDTMSYALNFSDWQPQELVRDVMEDSGYRFKILTPISIGVPVSA